MKNLLVIIGTLFCTNLLAQKDSLSKKESSELPDSILKIDQNKSSRDHIKAKGKVVIIEADSLQLLIDGYREQKQLTGYKVQLFSGRSRMDAVKVKSSFHRNYGESEAAEILYQQPNFKIRVGNYRDRLSATKALQVYKLDFPSAFLVKDVIKIHNKKEVN